jgi:hypothetical protein
LRQLDAISAHASTELCGKRSLNEGRAVASGEFSFGYGTTIEFRQEFIKRAGGGVLRATLSPGQGDARESITDVLDPPSESITGAPDLLDERRRERH